MDKYIHLIQETVKLMKADGLDDKFIKDFCINVIDTLKTKKNITDEQVEELKTYIEL